MELLELILFLLVAIVASSLLDQIVRGVSLPLVQIALGAVIAFAVYNPTLFEEILKALLLTGLGLGSGLTVFYGLVLPMLEEHFK